MVAEGPSPTSPDGGGSGITERDQLGPREGERRGLRASPTHPGCNRMLGGDGGAADSPEFAMDGGGRSWGRETQSTNGSSPRLDLGGKRTREARRFSWRYWGSKGWPATASSSADRELGFGCGGAGLRRKGKQQLGFFTVGGKRLYSRRGRRRSSQRRRRIDGGRQHTQVLARCVARRKKLGEGVWARGGLHLGQSSGLVRGTEGEGWTGWA